MSVPDPVNQGSSPMTNPLLNRILVPLDGSSHAEAILSQLRRILAPHHSELILLHATPYAPWANEEESEKYLRRVSFQLTNDSFPSKFVQRIGTPADTILDTASKERASLIALTTHGRSGVSRWVMGSVAERVLQASKLTVLGSRSFSPSVLRGQAGCAH